MKNLEAYVDTVKMQKWQQRDFLDMIMMPFTFAGRLMVSLQNTEKISCLDRDKTSSRL
jgi:hypothetical protein